MWNYSPRLYSVVSTCSVWLRVTTLRVRWTARSLYAASVGFAFSAGSAPVVAGSSKRWLRRLWRRMSKRAGVLREVLLERRNQDATWGEQNHPDGTGFPWHRTLALRAQDSCERATRTGSLTWRDILWEEVAEAFAESDPERLRAELIQVSAVAASWIEAIDRKRDGV